MGLFTAAPAAANCYYMGGYYGVGSTICSAGGWLEQCTVAGYWSAIGQCNAPDDDTGGALNAENAQVFTTQAQMIPGTEVKEEMLSKEGQPAKSD
jgi:hypothetical protein